MISGNQRLNSSPGPLSNDSFDILEESGSIVSIFGESTRPMSSTESDGGRFSVTVEAGSSTSSTNENQPESLMTYLTQWDINTI